MPNFYIIAGPNGAGKTTASYTILPKFLECFEFINADEIAFSLSPDNSERMAFEAGRIMLARIDEHFNNGIDFAVETTLSSKYYVHIIEKARKQGYSVSLIFLWLKSVETAMERVKQRVEKGGHDIPPDVITRRYMRGLYNFFNVFVPLCDNWILYDNNAPVPALIASGESKIDMDCIEESLYEQIKKKSNEYKY